jgi:hypothetical protein
LGLLPAPGRADVTTIQLDPISSPGGMYWRDITGTSYSPAFQSAFTYSNAGVSIAYNTYDLSYFTGTLIASGLKPNFAYQMKLNGKPTNIWGPSGDDATNERIGYIARWWRNSPGPGNANDADYNAHHADPAYTYTGYLVYDFFVTDATGSAIVPFQSDNSYHVLWKTSQRAPGANDGPIHVYNVNGTIVNLYGEWEPTRALPGTLVLPPGAYDVQFYLTEESFHDPSAAWASVMKKDYVGFSIAPEPATLALCAVGGVGLLSGLRRRRKASRA